MDRYNTCEAQTAQLANYNLYKVKLFISHCMQWVIKEDFKVVCLMSIQAAHGRFTLH